MKVFRELSLLKLLSLFATVSLSLALGVLDCGKLSFEWLKRLSLGTLELTTPKGKLTSLFNVF